MKTKKISFLLIIIFFCSNIFTQEFGSYNIYLNSCGSNKKWDNLIKNAYKMITQDNYEKAIYFFNKAIQKGNQCPQIKKDMVNCYIKLKEYD